jgi:hypothetical protein
MTRTDGFLCYAHADDRSPSRKFVEELQRHLRHIETEHDHLAWSDQNIRDGADWPTELRAALGRAAYAVLFVNIELIDSEFVREVELPALLKAAEDDGLLLLALRVGTCRLPDWLARIQFSNQKETPLGATRSRETRDRAYEVVAARVEEHLRGGPALSQSVRLMQRMVPPIAGGTSSPSLTGSSAALDDPRSADLADALSQVVAKQFEAIRERYLTGDRAGAITTIDELLALPNWAHLAASLRGRILRTAALYSLHFGQDPETAAELAERAKADDSEGDDQPLDVHLALHRGDRAGALGMLAQPRSPQARHLKAAILIEDGDAESALEVLSTPVEAAEDAPKAEHQGDAKDAEGNTAETWRLRALAWLLQKQLPDALAAIDAARALAPDWIAVRGAAAIIEFWRACTPTALAVTEQPLWPMPFARALVRAGSGERLAEIADTFADVAAAMPSRSDEHTQWLTWQLVARIAGGKDYNDGSALARQLLAGDGPPPVWPLVWAQYHGLDVDRDELKRRLAAVSEDDPNAVLFRGLYLEMRLEDGEVEQVLAELPELARLPLQRGHAEVPRQWQITALTAAGKLDDAEDVADEIADEPLRLRLRLLIAREREREQPGSHKAAAAALFAVDRGTDVLAEACEAHARAGDWGFVAEHADALLAAVPTPWSLRLLVNASFNQGQYQRCMAVLDAHRSIYPDGRLPPDLTLLRVRCQRMLGESSEAAREARRLWEEAPLIAHLIELIDLQIQGGDLAGARESLRRMLSVEDGSGESLLRGANLAAVAEDRELAVLLWRRAGEIGSEAPEFADAMFVSGNSLGAGSETAPWLQRVMAQAEAGVGSARPVEIGEMLDLMRERRETGEHIEGLYRCGQIPVHLLPEHLFPPLSVLFRTIPERNRANPDPLVARAIFARHGARPLSPPRQHTVRRGRLVLDITAILTASDLGLLDALEAHFAPLLLTPDWHSLLLDEIRLLSPSQPERMEAQRRVADLIRAGGITRVDLLSLGAPPEDLLSLVGEHDARALAWARAEDGRLVNFLPLTGPALEDRAPVDLPPDWRARLLGPRELLDRAAELGLIDSDSYGRGAQHFRPDPAGSASLVRRRDYLLACPGVLIALAEADLLAALAQGYRLAVSDHLWRHSEAELAQQAADAALADWLRALIDRLSAGLRAGTYRIAPSTAPPKPIVETQTRGLDDLLRFPGQPDDLIWIDDRLVNSYQQTDTCQVLSVVEVLDLLRAAGAISRADWHEKLYRLRASNWCFIPLAAGEIQHWLSRAHTESGRLIVPPQLDVLARYWAACLYPRDVLKRNGSERHPNGEMPFFISSQSAIGSVLCAIWSDARLNSRQRELRANWVLDNLYVGIADIAHLLPSPSTHPDMNLVGADVAGFCFGAFQVMFERIERDRRLRSRQQSQGTATIERALDAAQDYLRWASERILMPRLRADPESVQSAARALRSLLLAKAPSDEIDLLPLFGQWMLRFLPVMPRALRDELHKDQDLMERLGLAEVEITELHGLRFKTVELWSRIEAAIQGLRPSLHEADTGKVYSLLRVSEPDAPCPIVSFADEAGRTVGEGCIELSELLLDSRELRLQALRAHPHWWDGEPAGCEALERRLAALQPAELRIRRLIETMERSADARYLDLESAFRRQDEMSLDRLFPPPLSAVLTYIRCVRSTDPARLDIDAVWRSLVASIPPERGLGESLGRIALFPSALPEGAHQALRELRADEIARLLNRAAGALRDPLGRLHVLDLALTVADLEPAAIDIAQAEIDHLASEQFGAEARLLTRLADMAYRAFDNELAAAEATPELRLLAAWVHAARVAGILLRGGADAAHLAELLARGTPFPFRDLYGATVEPHLDLAWPWHVEPAHLAVVAVGAVLTRHPTAAERLDTSALRERLDRLRVGSPKPTKDFHLLHAVELYTDELRCLWGGDRGAALTPLCDADYAAAFSASASGERLHGLVTELEATPDTAEHWQTLWLYSGSGRLPDDLGACLANVVEGLDLDRLLAQGPSLLVPLLELAVRYTKDRERMARWLLDQIGRLDDRDNPPLLQDEADEDSIRRLAERLVHWLHQLALRHPEDPDAELARLFEVGIRRSRTFAAHLRPMLTGMLRQLPYSRHRALRRTLLAAKARPAPARQAASGAIR